MTSIVIQCDRCGATLETEERFAAMARHVAQQRGWVCTGDEHSNGPRSDRCPECVRREKKLERAIRAALPGARAKAAQVGPMHALWDVISDAEDVLVGKPTRIPGDRTAVLSALAAALGLPPIP